MPRHAGLRDGERRVTAALYVQDRSRRRDQPGVDARAERRHVPAAPALRGQVLRSTRRRAHQWYGDRAATVLDGVDPAVGTARAGQRALEATECGEWQVL